MIENISRLEPVQLSENVRSVQPGFGMVMRLELAWGRIRRVVLRTLRPGYVRRMAALRTGECLDCRHDIVDHRDLKFFKNVCGYEFPEGTDRFAWRGMLGVARIGLAEMLFFGSPLLALTILAVMFFPWGTIVPASFLLFVIAFFRDPNRSMDDREATWISPADGTVDDIEHLDSTDMLDTPVLKIGIFLSVFNVHVNRVPERSRVIEIRYFPGRFGNAMDRECAIANEQLWVLFEEEAIPHRRFLVKQIAGAIARRIVCEVKPGQILDRGERFGMIKFGSRTELYLPKEDGLCMEVQLKQTVRGTATVLARYKDEKKNP